MRELIGAVVELYLDSGENVSIRQIADEFGMTPLKIRKLLITAGVFSSDVCDQVLELFRSGKSVPEIQRIYLMDCLVEQNKVRNLKEYLDSVEFKDLGVDSIDFLIILGNAAIRLNDTSSIELLKKYLKDMRVNVPYFKFCLKELELELEKKSGKIMRLLNKLGPLKDYLILCFLQALFPQKGRLTSSKLHGEFPQYCISSAGTLSGAGEEPLQAYKVY